MWEHGTEAFSVANCYEKILMFRLKFFKPGIFVFDWSKVWLAGVPSKVSFCIWLLIRDSLLTHRNLQKRGFSLASKCVLCGGECEDREHLFRRCDFVSWVWSSLAGDSWCSANLSVMECLLQWKPRGITVHGMVMSFFLPHALFWTMWNERNRRIHEDKFSTVQQVICAVKEYVWHWYLGSEAKNKVPLEIAIFDWHRL